MIGFDNIFFGLSSGNTDRVAKIIAPQVGDHYVFEAGDEISLLYPNRDGIDVKLLAGTFAVNKQLQIVNIVGVNGTINNGDLIFNCDTENVVVVYKGDPIPENFHIPTGYKAILDQIEIDYWTIEFEVPVNLNPVSLDKITGLKPIKIIDENGEYFYDLDSALNCISQFGFRIPDKSYYNEQSSTFYLWYDSKLVNGDSIFINHVTEQSFGSDVGVSIQDEEGFISSIYGDCFSNNYSEIEIILGTVTFPNYNAFNGSQCDFTIGTCIAIATNFGANSSGNIVIKEGSFNENAFYNYHSGGFGNKLLIKRLAKIANNFCLGVYNARIDILETAVNFDATSFLTEDPIALHLPATQIGTLSANYLQLVANITNPDSVIIRE